MPHDLSGSGAIGGTSQQIIDAMNNLECNIDCSDTTDYDGELDSALNALVTSSTADEQKVLFIPFCQSEDGDDDTCKVPSI